jgi:hypothetical protein
MRLIECWGDLACGDRCRARCAHRRLTLAGTASASSGGVVIEAQDATVQVPAAKLTRGTNLFECVIHPWMQTKVTVE